jgi:phosphoribosylformylglycinamidine synthase
MSPKIAVILFPGTNCELEALRACKRADMKGEIFRWNDSKSKLKKYDGFIIPGGFSYEDRGRSGVIASKDPIMDAIRKEADSGKVVIGICNGAQILVEAGMIPGLTPGELEMGLSWNERIHKGKIYGVGFYNDWVYIRSDAKKRRSAFNNFENDTIMKIPIAHAEGRFTIKNKKILDNLIKNEQTLFRYCDKDGNIKDEFPVNPNGAIHNLAGVCNPEGNVMSLMPHPERTEVSGQPIFDSMSEYLTGKYKLITSKSTKKVHTKTKDTIEILKKKPDITITVELIITDNEERTLENTMKNNGFKDLKLKRKIYYGISIKDKDNLKKIASKLIKSGEIANLNKEIPIITIGDKVYSYDKTSGLTEIKNRKEEKGTNYFISDYDNFAGKSVLSKLKTHFPAKEITKIEKGVMWNIIMKKQENLEKLIKTHIFHNPNAMKLVAL